MITDARPELNADDWCIAQFELRGEGKHSLADNTNVFLVHGTRGEHDALRAEIEANGHWVTWHDASLYSADEARAEHEWLFATPPAPAPAVELPEEPRSSRGRTERTVRELLSSNADYQKGVERRLAAGLIDDPKAEVMRRHWQREHAELEGELAEFEATTSR